MNSKESRQVKNVADAVRAEKAKKLSVDKSAGLKDLHRLLSEYYKKSVLLENEYMLNSIGFVGEPVTLVKDGGWETKMPEDHHDDGAQQHFFLVHEKFGTVEGCCLRGSGWSFKAFKGKLPKLESGW